MRREERASACNRHTTRSRRALVCSRRRTPTRRRRPSSRPATSSPTRARSARRSPAPTSARGRFPSRREEFERALEIDPVNDYAHFGLGLCLLRQGDRIGARRHLKLAVAMRPDKEDYRAALARSRRARDATGTESPVVALRPRRRAVAGRRGRSPPRPAGVPRCGPRGCASRSCRTTRATGRRRRREASAWACRRRPPTWSPSAIAAASLLAAVALAPAPACSSCAGPGVIEALADAGLAAVDDGPAEAVVVGFHRELRLRRASTARRARSGRRALRRHQHGRHLPDPGRAAARLGRVAAAVATASGHRPEVAGKPEAPTVGSSGSGSAPPASWSATGRPLTARSPTRSAGRSRSCSRASPRRSRRPAARRSRPPPPFVAADLGALAPPALTAALAPTAAGGIGRLRPVRRPRVLDRTSRAYPAR